MATIEQHIDQWLHNRRFIATIEPDFSDWIIAATFYTALHAVDAAFSHHKLADKIVSHHTRNDVLSRNNSYQQVWKSYRPLHDLSRTVRYLAQPRAWVPFARIETDVLTRYLYPIEKSVQKLIQRNLELPKIVLTTTADRAG